VGIVFYRAHAISGNTGFVDVLADAVEAQGANALPVFTGSLRAADAERRSGSGLSMRSASAVVTR
jgi:cobaltochelatase CobN